MQLTKTVETLIDNIPLLLDMNMRAGNVILDPQNDHSLDDVVIANVVDRQRSIILSEIEETSTTLFSADLATKQRIKLRDDLMDCWVTVGGMAALLSIGSDALKGILSEPYYGQVRQGTAGLESVVNEMVWPAKDPDVLIDVRVVDLAQSIAEAMFILGEMIDLFGIAAASDIVLVMDSNFSKFDDSMEEFEKSAKRYRDGGMEVEPRESRVGNNIYYAVISSKEQPDLSGRIIPKGKFLKSYKFYEPQFK